MAHEHLFESQASFYTAPTGPLPRQHTMIFVQVCACGAYNIFPQENWAKCTPEFKAALEALAVTAHWKREP